MQKKRGRLGMGVASRRNRRAGQIGDLEAEVALRARRAPVVLGEEVQLELVPARRVPHDAGARERVRDLLLDQAEHTAVEVTQVLHPLGGIGGGDVLEPHAPRAPSGSVPA